MTTTITSETNNFMGGKSYKLNPLQSLKIVCTSMICGECQYYRRSSEKVKDAKKFVDFFLFPEFYQETTRDYFSTIVQKALDFDFQGTLMFIDKLRNEHYMRLNSNYLLVQAIHHPARADYNKKNPMVFRHTIDSVSNIPTDWTTQYRLLKESGKPIPTIWKKSIAEQLTKMSAYHAAKYIHGSRLRGKKVAARKTAEDKTKSEELKPNKDLANLVDLIRITHPTPSTVLNELVKDGKVTIDDSEQTWEKLRSAKKTWQEINSQIRLPHMALLRNLRNIMDEYALREDSDLAVVDIRNLVDRLVSGVKSGKQFPFRYFTAYKMLSASTDVEHTGRKRRPRHEKPAQYNANEVETNEEEKMELTPQQLTVKNTMRQIVLDGLNRCVLESVESIPPMKGRVDCLSDNSGSSRGGITSEYGTVHIYEIANLSAILTAYRATEGGSVWIFGDRLEEYKVSHDKPILEQLTEVNDLGNTVGGGTETGVWLFWEQHIRGKKHLDTVFIYSDMQAGTGGLYVDGNQSQKLQDFGGALNGTHYVDVLKLVELYRKRIYPKVNVFSVQVAGYDNSILPDILYRGAVLSGWTGKESRLAYEMTELWDRIEAEEEAKVMRGELEW
jgi:polyhydroxyalkanoate synthesis regulator phasin